MMGDGPWNASWEDFEDDPCSVCGGGTRHCPECDKRPLAPVIGVLMAALNTDAAHLPASGLVGGEEQK